jgi:NAD/NADP transhydrogenase alpha subunit
MSEPTLNPFTVLTVTLLSTAKPPDTGAVPKDVLPTEKITPPVMVAAVVELTDAASVVALPSVTNAGAVSNVVVVAADGPDPVPCTYALAITVPPAFFRTTDPF